MLNFSGWRPPSGPSGLVQLLVTWESSAWLLTSSSPQESLTLGGWGRRGILYWRAFIEVSLIQDNTTFYYLKFNWFGTLLHLKKTHFAIFCHLEVSQRSHLYPMGEKINTNCGHRRAAIMGATLEFYLPHHQTLKFYITNYWKQVPGPSGLVLSTQTFYLYMHNNKNIANRVFLLRYP